jgi:hypothetical protein
MCSCQLGPGIASGLQVGGTGTVSCKFQNNEGGIQELILTGTLYVPNCTACLIFQNHLSTTSGCSTDGYQSLAHTGILTY